MLKTIFKILIVFVIGAIGGIWSQAFLLPYLVEKSCFQRFEFIEQFKQGEVVVNPVEKIIIQENTGIKQAIEKSKKTIVGITSETTTGKILQGSGLIVSSDGLIITLSSIVPRDSETILFLDGEQIIPEILQRKSDFALLKVDVANLPTIGFTDFEKVSLGEKVILIGAIFQINDNREQIIKKIANQGIVKYFDQDTIHTNMFEKYYLWGSCLFDIEGNLIGMNIIDKEGRVISVPISKIRDFLGF